MGNEEKDTTHQKGEGSKDGDPSPRVDAETTETTAPSQQYGIETQKNLQPHGRSSITFTKLKTHTIDNARDLVEVWDGTTNTFSDGFYFIPYTHRSAAMDPRDMRYLMENYDAVAIDDIGFDIVYCNVDQTEWHSTAQDAIPTHRNPPENRYIIWEDNNGFWTSKETAPIVTGKQRHSSP